MWTGISKDKVYSEACNQHGLFAKVKLKYFTIIQTIVFLMNFGQEQCSNKFVILEFDSSFRVFAQLFHKVYKDIFIADLQLHGV